MFYLQNDLASVVDRTSDEQTAEFHQLTNLLFRTQEQAEEDDLLNGQVAGNSESGTTDSSYRLRSSVCDSLAQVFPDYMAQPRLNLTDFVAFDKIWVHFIGSYTLCITTLKKTTLLLKN